MTEENVDKIKEIKSNLKVSTDYLKQLGENAESSYDVWLSLNKDTADEIEITAKKVEMLGKKLLYNQQIIEYTKQAYLDIKDIAGEYAKDTIEAETLYLNAGKLYNNVLAERNNAVSSATEKEAKRVAEINKSIDQENFKAFRISGSKGDLSSFTNVKEIIENYNKFLNDHKETFLEVGGTYEDLVELAKKNTGYDKIEEAYKKGETGDISLLKPYVEARDMGTLMDTQIEQPTLDETVVSNAYKNGFRDLEENLGVMVGDTFLPVFYDVGAQGFVKLLEGMTKGIENNQDKFDALGENIFDRLINSINKVQDSKVTNNYNTNYNNNYNIEEMGSSAYRTLVNWERFQQLSKMRGNGND